MSILRAALVCLVVGTACSRPAPVASVMVTTLRSISISTEAASIRTGASQTVSAVGVYSDGSKRDLTGELTWRSSDDSLIKLVPRADGKVEVHAEKAGVAMVQVSLGDDSAAVPFYATKG